MHIRCFEELNQGVIDNNAELDRVLVSLDLQRFDVQVGIHSAESGVKRPDEHARQLVARVYPLIMAKFLEDGASGKIFWAYKKSKGVCA